MERTDEELMRLALDHAVMARDSGNTPVAAVIARGADILAVGENARWTSGDCTAHAEIVAIRKALAEHGAEAVAGSSCYTTMEPCPMCAWAIVEAGLARVVMGARHHQLGRRDYGKYRLETFYEETGQQIDVTDGVLAEECGAMRLEWMRSVGREA